MELYLGYIRKQYEYTQKVRFQLRNGTAPQEVIDDLYSDTPLVEDPTPRKLPRIGSKFQVDLLD